jgi:MFS family permease
MLGNLAGLASLYLVQGIVAGVGLVLVQIVEARGGSLEAQAGLLAWGGLPWVLKIVWGLTLDRWLPAGRREQRAFLIAAQLGVAAGMAWLAGRTDSGSLSLAWFVLNLLASLQDVGADAFAIDAVETRRRGLANALMAGARAFGAGFLGTMMIARMIGTRGPESALGLLAIACAVAALPLLFTASPERPTQAPIDWGELSRSWMEGPFVAGLGLGFFVLLADAATGAVAWEFLSTAGGWTAQDALETLSPWAAGFELFGFGMAAVVVDRVGPRLIIVVASAALGVAWVGFGAASGVWSVHAAVLTLAALESVMRAMLIAGVYAWLMNATAPRLRATQFVLFMAMINLARVVGPLVAPALVASLGFGGLYVAAGALQLIVAQRVMRARSTASPLPGRAPASSQSSQYGKPASG